MFKSKITASEADLTVLKEQIQNLDARLMASFQSLKETEKLIQKNVTHLKKGKAILNRPSGSLTEEQVSHWRQVMQNIALTLPAAPVQAQERVLDEDESAVHAAAFLASRQADESGDLSGFYKKTEENAAVAEANRLRQEMLILKATLKEAEDQNQKLAAEKEALKADLEKELNEGTKLEETAAHLQQALAAERAKTDSLALENTVLYETNASNQQIAKGLNAEKKCLKQQLEEFTVANEADNQVSDQLLEQQLKIAGENRRLIANLEEENRRYLVLDAESKTALEAKQCAEESATFAIKNLDLVQTELNQSIQGRQAAESALALRSAQLQRNIEDLKYLNADILELADLAEKNQGERNEFYTESQYGYLRQKCDDLQHRRNALLERMHAAEKAAKQAGLEVGYRESAHQAEVMGLKKEIIDLKDQITGLQQDCTVLRKADFAAENAILREKLKKAHAANKVSEVLKGLENSAVAGSLRLEKEKQELQTKVLGLESKLAEQSQSPRPLRPLNRLVVAMGFLSVGLAVAGCVTSASVFGLPLSPFLFIAAAVTCMVGFVASALDRKPLVPKEALAVKAALQRSPEASSFIMST